MEREVGRILTESDEGDVFTIIVYQEWIESRTLARQTSTHKGLKRLALTDGRAVEPTDEPDTFQIVETGQIIRKIT